MLLGRFVMDDETHVRLVDTHAKAIVAATTQPSSPKSGAGWRARHPPARRDRRRPADRPRPVRGRSPPPACACCSRRADSSLCSAQKATIWRAPSSRGRTASGRLGRLKLATKVWLRAKWSDCWMSSCRGVAVAVTATQTASAKRRARSPTGDTQAGNRAPLGDTVRLVDGDAGQPHLRACTSVSGRSNVSGAR